MNARSGTRTCRRAPGRAAGPTVGRARRRSLAAFLVLVFVLVVGLLGVALAGPAASADAEASGYELGPPPLTAPLAAPVTAPPAPPMDEHLSICYAQVPEDVDPNLLSLDVYSPAAANATGAASAAGTAGPEQPAPAGYPVVVMVHGGAWCIGDKANPGVAQLKSSHFVASGYVFVSVNYRLSPAVKHPAHVQDVAAALAWVHSNIASYGGDPDRIFVMGHSAGAHLAALAATDERYLAAHGKPLGILKGVILLDNPVYDLPSLLAGFEQSHGWLSDVIQMYEAAFGAVQEAWRDVSPRTYVAPGKGIPPFLIFATNWFFGEGGLAYEFVRALVEAGTAGRIIDVSYKNHESISRDIGRPGDEPTRFIMEFLANPAGG